MLRSDHTALAVRSLAQSREFYEFLGGRVVSKDSPHFVEIMLGDLRLHFVKAKAGEASEIPGPHIDHFCLSVDSVAELEELCRKLNDCGMIREHAPFRIQESPPLGVGFADHAEERPPRQTLYVKDPDGITLEVRCYK